MTTQLDPRTELMVKASPSCQLTCLPFPFCRHTRCQGTLVYSSAQTSGDSLDSFIQQRRHEVPWHMLHTRDSATQWMTTLSMDGTLSRAM